MAASAIGNEIIPAEGKPLDVTDHLRMGKPEAILISLVLAGAYHGVQRWVFGMLPASAIYYRWGPGWYNAVWDLLALPVPLVLCLGATGRSGLRLGNWRAWRRVTVVVLLPIAATAAVCPFTSNPFLRDRIGTWLISPAAQELMFSGYLYGLLASAFPGSIHRRLPAPAAVVMTAGLFVLWHVPNFLAFPASFAAFQLFYVFWGGICFLLARRWTGSILPGMACHMGANFIAWAGW